MGKRYVSPIVICPFYKSQAGNLIYCEGVCEGSAIHVAFASPQEREMFQDKACKTIDYNKQCCVAKAHEIAWEKEDKEGKRCF